MANMLTAMRGGIGNEVVADALAVTSAGGLSG